MWKRAGDVLIGRSVAEVSLSDDGLFIEFDEGSKLHVIKPFSVSDGRAPQDLIGETLIGFQGESSFERLAFSNGADLTVDLGDDAWAMVLSGPFLSVVWRGGTAAAQ